MLKIKISGGTGYLGTLISAELKRQNHEVRTIKRKLLYGPNIELSEYIMDADIIISLSGAPILQRWTKNNRKKIYDSRVLTTKNIAKAINNLPEKQRPKKFIAISAIGIYKSGQEHDESSIHFGDGFAVETVKDWEAALNELPASVNKIIFRTGLVLGKKAKTISYLLLPFKLGLGATIGNGKQAFPFVHEKDVVHAFIWAVEKYSGNSIFNLTAPEKITNRIFTKQLAKQLNRPVFLSIPKLIFKLVYGDASFMITEAPFVIPGKLLDAGFEFEYPDINSALEEIIGK